jgi:E3 ubiquitin-protein ligase RNF31
LGTSNVKSLQSQFLNKASTSSTATVKPQITKLKPSKLVPPKTLSKEPPSTFANKLTKLITPSINEKDRKQTEVKGSSEQKTADEGKEEKPLKDHSKAIVPKKKYMEHCFSDEYSTTTDDDEDDIKISPQRNLFTHPKKANCESDDETSDVRQWRWTIRISFI